MKGNKPDFHDAMGPEESQPFYEEFLKQMGEAYDPAKIKSIYGYLNNETVTFCYVN